MKRTAWTSVAVVALLLPPGIAAQALCAAPHSAPSLRATGRLETTEPMTGWFQFTYLRQSSDQFYDPRGDLRPLLGSGQISTNSFFLTTGFGITEGLEVWGQIPIHDLESVSSAGASGRIGVGDIRLAARAGSDLFGLPPIPLMVRGGIKIPGSSFPVDATIVPLSEGQVDWEVSAESGYYFASAFPLQVLGALGYRWRGLNDQTGRKPGNETFAFLAVGGPQNGWRWGLSAEGLWGDTPIDNGIPLPSSKRTLVQLTPSVAFLLGGTEIAVSAIFPVSGRNLAVGNALTLGFYLPWAMP